MNKNIITKFEFNLARYSVTNTLGENVILEIDYKNKKFQIISDKVKDRYYIKELKRIAEGLIARKHGENFAWKFQNGGIDRS